ncbi:MAG: thioesterase family protein [Propionibacteriales bacterium]|nr:thioesterase family protein [Propionibacteriales bacterium]
MTFHALFRPEGDLLLPQDIARSPWADNQMNGIATSGVLARELERAVDALGRSDVRPARYTVDLFRAPSMGPCRLTSNVVREGSRIVLVDATLVQDDRPVARASGLFLAPTVNPDGQVWQPESAPQPPSVEISPISDEPRPPLLSSDGIGWSGQFADHQNAQRKQTWQRAIPVVLGEDTSPFQCAASVADATSLVANWGSAGVQYINSDITLSLSRLPAGVELGLSTVSWSSHDGISIGTAIVYDRLGAIGSSSVTAIANARRGVDFEKRDPVAAAHALRDAAAQAAAGDR